MSSAYVDVNKELYLKALFLDAQKEAKMIDFNRKATDIKNYVFNNPTNSDTKRTINKNGVETQNGLIVIHASNYRRLNK